MMHSSSPRTASETWAQTGAARAGVQPDGDWLCRANCGVELAFRLINDLVPDYAAVRLGRLTMDFPRFRRHKATASSKLLEVQTACRYELLK
jgi:hypothetical protein